MKSIILFLFVFVSSFLFSFSNCLADEIGIEFSNDLSMESKKKELTNTIKNKVILFIKKTNKKYSLTKINF